MPRHDDDFEDDDERPRRRPVRRGDDEEALPRVRRSRRVDDDDEPPVRSRRRDRDDDDLPRSRPKNKSSVGLILGILAGVFLFCCGGGGLGLYLFWDKVSGAAGASTASRNNLMEIGIAMHHHSDQLGSFASNSHDLQGKPLLSWRVHLLPYLGEQALYSRFNLNEPWDGPTNKQLLAQMPKVYGTSSNNSAAGAGKTYYRGFSQSGAMFEKPRGPGAPMRIGPAGIMDGLSNTIFVVEAGEPVEWTKPDDIFWANNSMRPLLGGPSTTAANFWALMCDGSVFLVRKDINDQTLRNLIDRRDGNVIPDGWRR